MRSKYHTSSRRLALAALLLGLIGLAAPTLGSRHPATTISAATETFTTTITPSSTQVVPGQTMTVEVLLHNATTDRCFGLPQFRLYVETAPGVGQDTTNPIFTPAEPQPIMLNTGVNPGGSVSATFTLTAVRPGAVTLFTTVSGESTSANCQPPFFWAAAAPSRSTLVTVADITSYLPLVSSDVGPASR